MILVGGIAAENQKMHDSWSFDFGECKKESYYISHSFIPNLVTESWKLERILYPVSGHAMVVFGEYVVIFGGADRDGNLTNRVEVLSTSKF